MTPTLQGAILPSFNWSGNRLAGQDALPGIPNAEDGMEGSRQGDKNKTIPHLAGGLALLGTSVFAVMDGKLYRGKDNDASWASPNPTNWVLTSARLPHVNVIAVSGTSLFAGTDGGVFRSHDNGVSWDSVSTGLPTETVVRALIADGNSLFVGSKDAGVFRSDDNGGHWAAVGKTLPAGVSVAAITVLGKQLFVATEQWENPLARRAVVWKILL